MLISSVFRHCAFSAARRLDSVLPGRPLPPSSARAVTRHEPDEIEWLGTRSLQSLSAVLGDKPRLMGEAPSGVDAIVFAQLARLLTLHFDPPLRRPGDFNLGAYVDRMMGRFDPDVVRIRAGILEAA